MNNGKKALNVLGIILSALLSIVLVVMLMASPLVMSVVSVLNPHAFVDAVTEVDLESTVIAIVDQAGYELDDQRAKQLSAILSADAVKDVMKNYAQNMLDVLSGKADFQGFTEEMLQKLVQENKGELVKALRQSGGEFASMSDQELEEKLQTTVDENMGQILQMLPDPQELKETLLAEEPGLKQGIQLLTAVDMVNPILAGILILLSIVIFFCRFADLRGMKWLAVDLLIAGVISAAVCVSFGQLTTLLLFTAEENVLISNLLTGLLGSVKIGLILRTVIILVVAAGLLVGYILIQKNKKKKSEAAEKPAVQAAPEEKTTEQTAEERAAEEAQSNT